MKKPSLLVFIVLLLPVILATFALGYFGFIPKLAAVLGTNKPRDLGVTYTEKDLASAKDKSKIKWEALSKDPSAATSLVREGTRVASFAYTSQEATALINNVPWKYWPYKNMQVRFNSDGSAEASGILVKDRLMGYGRHMGMPKEVIDFALRFIPENPVFYIKMKFSLKDNKVAVFEPQSLELGRLPLPIDKFLSLAPVHFAKPVYAQNSLEMSAELSKVKNKRQLIIDFVNYRITQTHGFFAKDMHFEADKMVFDGNLPEKELMMN